MFSLPTPILSAAPHFTLVSIVDILLVSFLIYQLLMIIRGRRAAHILMGIAILSIVYGASHFLGLELLRAILATAAPYAPLAFIVMFQSEIRRMLAKIGRKRWPALGSRIERREFAEEIVLAVSQMAQQRTGALIVIERDIGLRTFIESGVMLDACVSRDLLLTIFKEGSALHDGAAIIQSDRIASAACFLPLSVKPGVARELGTRHRAAIGVTEETDCFAIIVSEESGRISIAAFGEIEQNVQQDRLEERISAHILHKQWGPPARAAARRTAPERTEALHEPRLK